MDACRLKSEFIIAILGFREPQNKRKHLVTQTKDDLNHNLNSVQVEIQMGWQRISSFFTLHPF